MRQVVVTVVGHVDHGKSSILDKIRNTSIVASEPGAITQSIGASIIPLQTIKKICGPLLQTLKMDIKIPGLLTIDTPGHAAFTNLRKRGGNLADIAIVVIDINEGVKPQTQEAIDILKHYKTPFIIALNKIDLIAGWQTKSSSLLQSISQQPETIKQLVEKKLYELVGKLSEMGFNSERFDRVEDYTKQIAIIPVSAKTGEGIPELLMVVAGLSQKFLEQALNYNLEGPAKGIILEVKDSKGLGTALDVIIYDGTLRVNDMIVVGTLAEPIVTKVRALFEPAPLAEMRDKKAKFNSVKEVKAATGVKISAPNIGEAVAGMPVVSCKKDNIEEMKQEVQKEVEEVLIETYHVGIVVKADSLGSLEALTSLLRGKGIQIKRASIGSISKKDIVDAKANYAEDPLQSVVLGFNVESELEEENVKVITSNIIYRLIEEFEKWQLEEKKRLEAKKLEFLIRPCRLQLMKGYMFRQSNPAVCGVDVLAGTLYPGTPLMNLEGKEVADVKGIQMDQENLEKAERGKQVAVSMEGVTIGRQVQEGDTLITAVPEEHFKKLKALKEYLSEEEKAILKEIAEIKRKDNPVWGI